MLVFQLINNEGMIHEWIIHSEICVCSTKYNISMFCYKRQSISSLLQTNKKYCVTKGSRSLRLETTDHHDEDI